MTQMIIYKKKNGEIRYYSTYQLAWNGAIRLNAQEKSGQWYFEADEVGWFLFYVADDAEMPNGWAK
jgi:hypothetical protein